MTVASAAISYSKKLMKLTLSMIFRNGFNSSKWECLADLKEGIASLIFVAPRCAEIPELVAIRDIFEKNYGKDFVSAATDLQPNCGVNRLLLVKTPSGELKLKVMKEIAKEHNIEWDTTESEKELLKPPEELIVRSSPSTPFSLSSYSAFTRSHTPYMKF
ncbi:hypothetical protein REPUB_Repub10bG0184100 [Reevesia pubescens]